MGGCHGEPADAGLHTARRPRVSGASRPRAGRTWQGAARSRPGGDRARRRTGTPGDGRDRGQRRVAGGYRGGEGEGEVATAETGDNRAIPGQSRANLRVGSGIGPRPENPFAGVGMSREAKAAKRATEAGPARRGWRPAELRALFAVRPEDPALVWAPALLPAPGCGWRRCYRCAGKTSGMRATVAGSSPCGSRRRKPAGETFRFTRRWSRPG